MMALFLGFIGVMLMIFVVAFIASREDNYVHPWDYEDLDEVPATDSDKWYS